MYDTKIKNAKKRHYITIAIALPCALLAMISFVQYHLFNGFVFMLIASIGLCVNIISDYRLTKNYNKDVVEDLKVPSLLKGGITLNPNTQLGTIVFYQKVLFTIVTGIVSALFLILSVI